MDERTEANRANWEERAAVHPDTEFYDVASFLDGDSTLRSVELAALDDRVDAGTRLCHLMCHIGLDTLSWARKGATVTGVDFSPTALETARALAADAGLDDRATFVESDVYDAPSAVSGAFDVVVATYGVLVWLEDIGAFADVAADLLAPGGTFLLVDGHPLSHAIGDDGTLASDYFREAPCHVDQSGTYADPDAEFEHTETYQWSHTLGEVVTAVADAGLRVEALTEYPYTHFEKFDGLVERDGWWEPGEGAELPLLFSLEASRPAPSE